MVSSTNAVRGPQSCALDAVRGSPDPARAPTVGLLESPGDLRSLLSAGSGDPRRARGLAYAFDKLGVPDWHRMFFPAGLGTLLFFAGIAYLFPRPPDLDPFYYWTRGWPMVLSLIGLACLALSLVWTAGVLVVYTLFG